MKIESPLPSQYTGISDKVGIGTIGIENNDIYNQSITISSTVHISVLSDNELSESLRISGVSSELSSKASFLTLLRNV